MGFNSVFKELKSDKNDGFFKWRPIRICDYFSLNS